MIVKAVRIACAIGLSLVAPLSLAQADACTAEAGVVTCIGSVLRIPQQDRVSCESGPDSPAALVEQLQSDQRDEAAARVRLAEARMEDAERVIPEDHTDLEQNFEAARSHVSSDKQLDRDLQLASRTRCSDDQSAAELLDDANDIELTFDAPMQCLQSLQRSRGTELSISVDNLGGHALTGATAKLVDVVTVIQDDTTSVARARAQLDAPTVSVLEGDSAVVHFACAARERERVR